MPPPPPQHEYVIRLHAEEMAKLRRALFAANWESHEIARYLYYQVDAILKEKKEK